MLEVMIEEARTSVPVMVEKNILFAIIVDAISVDVVFEDALSVEAVIELAVKIFKFKLFVHNCCPFVLVVKIYPVDTNDPS